MATAEVIPFNPNEITVFSEFENKLAKVKKDNSTIVFDYASRKGNKEARSYIQKHRNSKTAITSIHKEEKSGALEYGRKLDVIKNRLHSEFDEMIELHAKPLREIEEKEKARIEAHNINLSTFNQYDNMPAHSESSRFEAELQRVEKIKIDSSWEEFKGEAALLKDGAITALKEIIQAKKTQEAEQAELKRLRQEKFEREQKERNDQIAKEAEDKANREAEARAEQLRLDSERAEQVKEDKRLADEKEKERQRVAGELAKDLALEKAKRLKAEAETKLANAQKDAKVKAEKDLKDRQKREADAARKREANKKHHAKINNEALAALERGGVPKEAALLSVTLIAKHLVPHTTIKY